MRKAAIVGAFLVISGLSSASAYWQQDVHYKINAEFVPSEDKIMAQETLIYTNNSPDTLNQVYFHLYLNAFQPGSPLDLVSRQEGDYSTSKLAPKQWGRMEIKKLEVGQREITDFKIDYSIMQINLPEKLLPGQKIEFYLEFEDQLPPNGARMGKSGKHYDIGQWYPKIAVYDRFGWHNEQYLGTGEFYGDFGKFEVSFTAPKEYILGHTGQLLNEEELFPGLPQASEDTVLVDVLQKYKPESDTAHKEVIAAKNAKGGSAKGDNSQSEASDSVIETRNWKMQAENVHDFFIAANPDFIWDRAQWGNVTINTLYPKDAIPIWQKKAAEDTKFYLKFMSEKFGEYPYTQFTSVAGAVRGGMEYPQIITMSKRIGDPVSHRFFSVLGHEIAHNWFYGLIGSNETRQACLDEGFTSFATILLMEERYGRYDNSYTWQNWIQKTFYTNDDERTGYARSYLRRANQKEEEPIDTHSDRFVNPRNYRVAVYTKTASVLFMLQYTLGDSLFGLAMKEYFNRWYWKHPYLSDFQAVMEDMSKQSLDWFFDEWFEKTWRLDYGIASVKSKKIEESGKGYLTEVKIKKEKEAVMPLDLHFRLVDGSTYSEKVPVDIWLEGRKEYVASVELPSKPKSVDINPDQRLLDVNRLNNYFVPGLSTTMPKLRFDYNYLNKHNPVPVDAYQFLFNPSIWYNDVDGLKSGVRLKGSYLEWSHNLDLGMWMGPQSGRFHYDLSWKEPAFWLGGVTYLNLRSFYLDGRRGGAVSLERNQLRTPGNREYFEAHGSKYGAGIYAYRLKDDRWLPPTVTWQKGDLNFAKLYYQVVKPGRYYDQKFSANFSTDFFRSDFNFNRFFSEYRGELDLGLPFSWAWRVAFGYANGNVSVQSKFYLASASPLEEFDNIWYRSRGSLPNKWRDKGNLYLAGGGNVRGYADQNLAGNKLFSFNLKWSFPNYLKLIPAKIPYLTGELNSIRWDLFYDFGSVWDTKNAPKFENFFSDLGIGLVYRIPYLDQIIPDSRVRFDFPFWVDKPANGEKHFKFRWLFSVGAGIL